MDGLCAGQKMSTSQKRQVRINQVLALILMLLSFLLLAPICIFLHDPNLLRAFLFPHFVSGLLSMFFIAKAEQAENVAKNQETRKTSTMALVFFFLTFLLVTVGAFLSHSRNNLVYCLLAGFVTGALAVGYIPYKQRKRLPNQGARTTPLNAFLLMYFAFSLIVPTYFVAESAVVPVPLIFALFTAVLSVIAVTWGHGSRLALVFALAITVTLSGMCLGNSIKIPEKLLWIAIIENDIPTLAKIQIS